MLDGWKLGCRWCGEVFVVCRECDRNRRKYCSEVCSEAAVRQSQREARRRHQQSEEGLADHRDRNRKWRARQREQERVMDRCSEELPDFATMCLAPRAGAPHSDTREGRPALARET